jgi:enterochelin esterase family protein
LFPEALYDRLACANLITKNLNPFARIRIAPGGDNSRDATTEGNFMVKQFLASPKLPLRFYLAAGTFEIDRDGGGGGGILESTRHLRDVLLARGYQVHYQQFVGGHDGLNWRGTLADGLIELLGIR